MPEEDAYLFENLARLIAINHVKGQPNIPASAAALTMDMILTGVASTKFKQDPATTATSICSGILAGVVQVGGDLPDTAVAILHHITHATSKFSPQEIRNWAIAGIAKASLSSAAATRYAIEQKIEAHFKGAGTQFKAACAQAQKV